MTSVFIRNLIVHTVCNVTGDAPEDVLAPAEIELDTRDWEQVFSRLEACLDIHTGRLTAVPRRFCIDELAQALHEKVAGDVIV